MIWIQYHARQMQMLGLPNRPVRDDEQGRNHGTSYNCNYSTYSTAITLLQLLHAYGLRACARLPCHRRQPAMVVSDELGLELGRLPGYDMPCMDEHSMRRLDQHYKRGHPKVTRIYYIRHTYVSCAPYFIPFTGVMGAKY